MTESQNVTIISDEEARDQLIAELETLNTANMTTLQALARDGAQVDPASVLSMRIDTLAEMTLGDGILELLKYKLSVQRKLADALRLLASQVRQASMAMAARATPQQVQQLARATGLLGPDDNPLSR
jgi:hypothetical protein